MSFLKIITRADSSVDAAWGKEPGAMYHNMPKREKCVFLLEQAVLINYLDRVYGTDKLPKLIQSYKEQLVLHALPVLKEKYYKHDKDRRDVLLSKAYPNIAVLLGASNGRIDAAECASILKNYSSICKIEESFYTPYLLFVEKTHGVERYTVDNIPEVRTVQSGLVSTIPSFHMSGRYLTVSYEVAFPSYKLDHVNMGKLKAAGILPDSILSYWSGYNWAGKTISSVIGVLAAQCLEKDMNAITKGSNMFGYLGVYTTVIPLNSCVDQSNSLALSSDITIQNNRIIKFMCHIRETFGVKFDDKELLVRYMSNMRSTDSNLTTFLSTKNAKDISVEMYDVFKNSQFGKFSELDLVISGRLGRENQSGSIRNAKKTKEEDDDTEAQQEDPDESTQKPEEKESGTTSKSTPDASVFDGPDEATKLDDQDTANEEPSEEPKEDEASNSDDLGNQPDEEPNNPDESSTQEKEVSDTTHTNKRIPALPKVDDKRGVRLSLSEGESTSTVLYREELAAYIDSLLANPPSNLSVQTVAAIKRLKANWLYLLSVQDVHDFLAALISVPKTLTIKK